MLAIPPFGASSNIALWRADNKPPLEVVVANLDKKHVSALHTLQWCMQGLNKISVLWGCEMRRKILKRVVTVAMTLCMGIGLCGCSGSKEAQDKNYDIKHGDDQYFVMDHYQISGGNLLDMSYVSDEAVVLSNDNGSLKYLTGSADSDIWDENIIDDIDESQDKAYVSAACVDTDGTVYSAVYTYNLENNEIVDGSTEIRRYDEVGAQNLSGKYDVVLEGIDKEITGISHVKDDDSYYLLTTDGLNKFDSNGKLTAQYDESNSRDFVVADKIYLLADQKMVELDSDLNVVSESSGLYDSLKEDIDETVAKEDSTYSNGKKILKADSEDNLYILTDRALYKKQVDSKDITMVLDDTDGYENSTNTILQFVLCGDRYITIDSEHNVSVYAVNDGTVKVVEKQEITLWSLRYAPFVEQAVDIFNNMSNSITVKYEYGVGDDNGVTIKDAVNALNTELLSGKGPDVILTDGLNINSYIDNGAFLDLAELETEIQKKYSNCLNKVMDTYRMGDKVYAIPARMTFQAVIEPDDISGSLNYISDFQDYIDNSEPTKVGNDLDIYDWTILFEDFYPQYVNDFIKDEKFDTDTFKTFLEELHTLWKTLESRTSQESFDKWESDKIEGEGRERQFSWRFVPLVDYEYSGQSIAVGTIEYTETIKSAYGYRIYKGDETHYIKDDHTFRALVHNGNTLYTPIETFAINSNTEKADAAKTFIMKQFDKELQFLYVGDPYYTMGLPVNLDDWEYEEYVLTEGGKYVSGSPGTYAGYATGYDSMLEDDDLIKCFEILKGLDTPVNDDIQVRNIIEEGIDDYMNDKKSLDDTVKDIDNQLGIYFSE